MSRNLRSKRTAQYRTYVHSYGRFFFRYVSRYVEMKRFGVVRQKENVV